jgi:hypothetical protein
MTRRSPYITCNPTRELLKAATRVAVYAAVFVSLGIGACWIANDMAQRDSCQEWPSNRNLPGCRRFYPQP